MRIPALAAAAALSIQPVAAQRADDVPLRPAGAWGIDYGENICTLSRRFGTGEQQVALGFIPLTGGSPMKIIMIGAPNGHQSGMGNATLAAGGGEPLHHFYYTTTDPKTAQPITLIKAGRDDLARIVAADTLTIRTGRRQVRFALPGMAAALQALEACERDLAKTWGFDLAAIATPARPIKPGTWLSDGDYPQTALLQRKAGQTDFRVTVGADGKPTACAVTLKSGTPALDERACTVIMRRGRFEPAIGTDGKPVPGLFASSVLWMLAPSQFY